ncbi:hypothetical protein ACQRUO_07105, partial [Kitasatospora sp. LaBMicrA B282]
MSYAPPVGGFQAPQRAPKGEGGGALPGLAILLIVTLLLDFGILGFDLSQEGASYLQYAIGFNFGHFHGYTAVAYNCGNLSSDVAIIAMIIGAFSGARWVRPAGTVLLLTNAYVSIMSIVQQLTGDDFTRHEFASPASHLLVNLDLILQAVLGLVFALIVAATAKRTPSATPAPGFASPYTPPMPGAPMPGAPMQGAPMPGAPMQGAPMPGAMPGAPVPPAAPYGAPIPPQPAPGGYGAPAAAPAQPPA